MNITTIAGRIGQDASTREVGETTVTSFSVADDYRGKAGAKETRWWNCSLWGARGTALEQYLTKGASVTVAGEAGVRIYTKDGETKASLECRVSEIALQGGRQESGNTSSSGGRGGAPQRERPTKATDAPKDDFASDDIPFASRHGNF
jgi:single-strand DNA-binding protein